MRSVLAAVWATDRAAPRPWAAVEAQFYTLAPMKLLGWEQYLISVRSGHNMQHSNNRCSVGVPLLLLHREPACTTPTACTWEVCQYRAPGRAALEATPFAGKSQRCCLQGLVWARACHCTICAPLELACNITLHDPPAVPAFLSSIQRHPHTLTFSVLGAAVLVLPAGRVCAKRAPPACSAAV